MNKIAVEIKITRLNLDKGNTETVVSLRQDCNDKHLGKVLDSVRSLYFAAGPSTVYGGDTDNPNNP